MAKYFWGEQTNTVHKMRVVIPSQFKNILPEEIVEKQVGNEVITEKIRTVVVTLGRNSEILVYPVKAWEKIFKRNAEHNKRFLKYHLKYVYTQELEGPGRIRISEKLQAITKVTDKVDAIIRGEGSHMSIWNPEVYAEYEKSTDNIDPSEFDEMDYWVVEDD